MQDISDLIDDDLPELSYKDWRGRMRAIGDVHGFYEDLGPAHHGLFVEDGDTLLVTFESFAGIQTLSNDGMPLGYQMVQSEGWSHLAVVSKSDTWFRAPEVYGFFDQLSDDGFFDEFDKVVFYGAGPCGYAAAAFSVSAQGARILALQPQATLDPRVSEWDERFTEQRRMSFTDRYGYAPDMLDAAQQAYVLYDPREHLDAVHSALFNRSNVKRFRMPFMGAALQSDIIDLDLLEPLLIAVASDTLTDLSFAKMLRARRDHVPYLMKLLAKLDADGREGLALMLCENVVPRHPVRRFRRRLRTLRHVDGDETGNEDEAQSATYAD